MSPIIKVSISLIKGGISMIEELEKIYRLDDENEDDSDDDSDDDTDDEDEDDSDEE